MLALMRFVSSFAIPATVMVAGSGTRYLLPMGFTILVVGVPPSNPSSLLNPFVTH
jgi:hypothetical protein